MKLFRKGLHRDHGKTLIFEEDKIKVNSAYDYIWFYATGGDSSGSKYFFELELTYEDIATIIESLEIKDKESNKINEPLKNALSNKTKSLFRLLMLSSDLLEDSKKNDNGED